MPRIRKGLEVFHQIVHRKTSLIPLVFTVLTMTAIIVMFIVSLDSVFAAEKGVKIPATTDMILEIIKVQLKIYFGILASLIVLITALVSYIYTSGKKFIEKKYDQKFKEMDKDITQMEIRLTTAIKDDSRNTERYLGQKVDGASNLLAASIKALDEKAMDKIGTNTGNIQELFGHIDKVKDKFLQKDDHAELCEKAQAGQG